MVVVALLKALAPFAPAAQFIAYSLLTVASVVVASTQLFLAYRQQFGWRPLALLIDSGAGWESDDISPATLSIEVWNRRKYPILIRQVYLTFPTVELVDDPAKQHAGWHVVVGNKHLFTSQTETIEPSGHHTFKPSFFIRKNINKLNDRVLIDIRYFDPKADAYRSIRLTHHVHLMAALDLRR